MSLARLCLYEALLVLPPILITAWTFRHLGGMDWKTHKDNWHPVCMVLGMIFCFFNGELERCKLA